MPSVYIHIFVWVNWIGAIANIQLRRSAISIHLFRDVPLQFPLYLRCDILYVFVTLRPTCRLWYFRMDKNTPATSLLSSHLCVGATLASFLLPFSPIHLFSMEATNTTPPYLLSSSLTWHASGAVLPHHPTFAAVPRSPECPALPRTGPPSRSSAISVTSGSRPWLGSSGGADGVKARRRSYG